MKLVDQFTKLALHYIHSNEGKTVMCPYCYTSQIEPGNILGITDTELIGTPLYGVRIIGTLDDNKLALNIEPNPEHDVPFNRGITRMACPNCGAKYFMCIPLSGEPSVYTYGTIQEAAHFMELHK